MKLGKKYISLHSAIVFFVCTVVILAFMITGFLTSREVAEQTKTNQAEKAMNVARMVGHSPLVVQALEGKRDQKAIQSFAKAIRQLTNVRFIVVMDMNHIRQSHPDEEKIGEHFVGGDEDRAMNGKEYTSVAQGTLGMSMRAFSPIRNSAGEQIGVVAVGIMLDKVQEAVENSKQIIYLGIAIGILVGIIGALILARKVKRILFGLEPNEIASLWQERNAMLQSVREGILAVNWKGEIVVANAEAIRMFQRAGMDEDPIGKDVDTYMPASRLKNVLESGKSEFDREQDLNGISLVVNRVPVKTDHEVVGALATFRDKTELKQLAEQLTGVKLYAEALRVKTHEFMNKLHVILGLVHTGSYDKLAAYIKQITDQYQVEIGSVSRLVKEPVLAGFLLSKLSYAREHGVELNISGTETLPRTKDPEIINDLITILGNLIDNAIEAVEQWDLKKIDVSLGYDGSTLFLSVRDTGGAILDDLKERIYEKGFSTKGEDRGYGLFLVKKSVEKHGGTLKLVPRSRGTQFTVKLPYRDRNEAE